MLNWLYNNGQIGMMYTIALYYRGNWHTDTHTDGWTEGLNRPTIYMYYGITLWGNKYNKYLHKLEILQNKAIRTITCFTHNGHTSPLFKH